MKATFAFAALLAASSLPAVAEPTPAPGHKVEAAALNGDSPIESLAASATGKAALEKHVPGVLSHAAYEQFKGMSLRALAPLSGGIITDERIAALETDLKAAK